MKRLVTSLAVLLAAAAAYAQEKHGTSLAWERSVDAAAAKAKEEKRLVLVLHISGKFDDPDLT